MSRWWSMIVFECAACGRLWCYANLERARAGVWGDRLGGLKTGNTDRHYPIPMIEWEDDVKYELCDGAIASVHPWPELEAAFAFGGPGAANPMRRPPEDRHRLAHPW